MGSRDGLGFLGRDRMSYVPSVSSFPPKQSPCSISCRLAFVTLKNNLMVLSLRAMIMQFLILMMIAAFCFGGFLYALWTCVVLPFPSSFFFEILISAGQIEPQ
jgi:hypothetical protein